MTSLDGDASHTEVLLINETLDDQLQAANDTQGEELTTRLRQLSQSVFRLAALGEELLPMSQLDLKTDSSQDSDSEDPYYGSYSD